MKGIVVAAKNVTRLRSRSADVLARTARLFESDIVRMCYKNMGEKTWKKKRY